jgi:hypothetical protein
LGDDVGAFNSYARKKMLILSSKWASESLPKIFNDVESRKSSHGREEFLLKNLSPFC